MTKIKLFRLERDLKAKDLAKDLDIHPGTISTLENRKIRASKWVRYKLSSFYGVPEEELFNEMGYAKSILLRR